MFVNCMTVFGTEFIPGYVHWDVSSHFHLEYTRPATKIAPKNGLLEYYFPIGVPAYFQGRTVSFREGKT